MYKITNIDSIGTEYTVADQTGKIIKTIQVVPHTEILDAALGPITEEFHSVTDYLEKSIAVLSGVDKIDPLKVLWFSTYNEEIILSELIEYAVHNGYDRIILELLEDQEETN